MAEWPCCWAARWYTERSRQNNSTLFKSSKPTTHKQSDTAQSEFAGSKHALVVPPRPASPTKRQEHVPAGCLPQGFSSHSAQPKQRGDHALKRGASAAAAALSPLASRGGGCAILRGGGRALLHGCHAVFIRSDGGGAGRSGVAPLLQAVLDGAGLRGAGALRGAAPVAEHTEEVANRLLFNTLICYLPNNSLAYLELLGA